MIRITTGSRLHFGLLALPREHEQPSHWPDREGHLVLPARHFGGVGLMIDSPGLRLSVAPAASWSSEGPAAQRGLTIGQQLCGALGISQAFRIVVDYCAAEHVGLGTGTQLALAVARGIADITGRQSLTVSDLARLAGRGGRSALGVHGFGLGGFLVEGGKGAGQEIAPLLFGQRLPADWAVLTMVPAGLQGDHGPREAEAFRRLALTPPDLSRTEVLCRLVLLGMLPALSDGDVSGFGEAVYDFNRRVGEMFAPWQGGIYSHPRVQDLVAAIRRFGIAGAGQSSWGPTVFAIVQCPEQAIELRDWLTRSNVITANDGCAVSKPSGGAVVERC
jgi:beta-RFAP synthase